LTNIDQLTGCAYTQQIMTRSINLYEAKTNLSQLVERAAAGEEIIIAKAGRPLARLVAFHQRREVRKPGLLKGEIRIAPDFDAPLPADIERGLRGGKLRLLLDTHAFLWWLEDSPSLSAQARAAISDASTEIFVSAATAWEIAIKHALGRLVFPIARIEEIVAEAGFVPLPVLMAHAVAAGALPQIHQDPFDRMLVAQAQKEGLTIMTDDRKIPHYAVAAMSAR
jgi:prevent-host-death family protein